MHRHYNSIKLLVSTRYHVVLYVGKRRYSIKLWKTFTDCFNCLSYLAT